MGPGDRRDRWIAVGALLFLLVVTVGWWALALWPVPGGAPEWLERARWVCFNAGDDGLPDASGWLLLIGQPIGMLAVLMVVWGQSVRAGLQGLASAPWGRLALGVLVATLLVGLGAAGVRVARASAAARVALPGEEIPPDTYPRLDRPAPELGLVSQLGEPLQTQALEGRPALVTFAFGQCETVCPAVVQASLEAQSRVREQVGPDDPRVPRIVVVTLDPWRDTPSRLGHMVHHWKLGEDALVLSGDVEAVNQTLDRWNVARQRDESTGDVVHPPLVYIVDAEGRIAYATSGTVTTLVELLGRV